MSNISMIWCGPFLQACQEGGRRDARVRPEEVAEALKYFRAHSLEPRYIYLNKSMIATIGGAIPAGIEIIEHNGVASWEIWAGEDGNTAPVNTFTGVAARKPLDSPPNQQECPTAPDTDEQPTLQTVTIKPLPAKLPYHRRGQMTIYDQIIDKAIASGGSYRVIANRLGEQGIIISHMTISRRIKEPHNAG